MAQVLGPLAMQLKPAVECFLLWAQLKDGAFISPSIWICEVFPGLEYAALRTQRSLLNMVLPCLWQEMKDAIVFP